MAGFRDTNANESELNRLSEPAGIDALGKQEPPVEELASSTLLPSLSKHMDLQPPNS